MISKKNKQTGVSLIEVLLVLTIGLGILYISIQQYLAYQRDVQLQQIRNNVDILFQAMTKYFRAHCRTDTDFSRLNGTGIVAIDRTQLVNEGFLTQTFPINPFVDTTGPGGGYVLTFFQYAPGFLRLPQRQVTLSTASGGSTVSIGNIVIWKAQVAVNLDTSSSVTATAYKNALGADCLSTVASGWGGITFVNPCEVSSGAGTYAVWARAPSYQTAQTQSPYWLSMPLVKQFTQMYTTENILLLTTQGPGNTWVTNQYYVCGN